MASVASNAFMSSPKGLIDDVCSSLTRGSRIHVASLVLLKEPAERLEAEQQAAGHLIGSRRPDHMLIHCQYVA